MIKNSRIAQEKETVEQMIRLFCRKKEKNKELCSECKALLQYAHERLDHCPFKEGKGTCKNCRIHCYKTDMREKMRNVMRYSGPRMIFFAPRAAWMHLIKRNS